MEKINPYYNPEKFELEIISFDEPDMSYEFNTLCFWATKSGKIYTAMDSGYGYPTPFKDCEGETQKEVLQRLERVGHPEIDRLKVIYLSWRNNWDDELKTIHGSEEDKLVKWYKSTNDYIRKELKRFPTIDIN